MKKRINYDTLLDGKGGDTIEKKNTGTYEVQGGFPTIPRHNLSEEEPERPKYDWKFWWGIVFIMIIGCLFIIWIKKGMP